MYCSKCGAYNPEDARFCSRCGERLVPENAPNDIYAISADDTITNDDYATGGNPEINGMGGSNCGTTAFDGANALPARVEPELSGTSHTDSGAFRPTGTRMSVVGIIKGILSSNFFLAATALLTASVVLSLLQQILTMLDGNYLITINKFILQLRRMGVQFDPNMYGIIGNIASAGQLVGVVSSALMGGIPVIGLWLLCFDSREQRIGYVNPRGMTLLRVMALIELILVSIYAGFALISTIVTVVMITMSTIHEIFFLIPVTLFLLGTLGFVVFCFAKLYMSVNSLRYAMRTGIDDGKVSKFAAVMIIIVGSMMAFTAFTAPSTGMVLQVGRAGVLSTLVTFVGGVSGALAYIFLGSMLIQYKNAVKSALHR